MINKITTFLRGKKTYTIAIVSISSATYLFATGQLDSGQFMSILSTALVSMGLRAGISNQ